MKSVTGFSLMAVVLAAGLVFADDDGGANKGPIADLCASGMEGSAVGNLGSKKAVRMNLFCIDPGRMAASAYVEQMSNPTMTYSATASGVLTLAQFPMTPDDRKGISSTTSMTYVKLNLEKLKTGVIRGYYLNGNIVRPVAIVAQMDQMFPPVAKMISKPIAFKDFIGLYTFRLPNGKGDANPNGYSDVELWADVLSGVPLFNMFIHVPLSERRTDTNGAPLAGGRALHFVDGPLWMGLSGFQSTTSFADTNTTGTPLWHIRGRVLDTGLIEIYLVDPVNGVRGPITAKRVFDPWQFMEMALPTGPDLKKLQAK